MYVDTNSDDTQSPQVLSSVDTSENAAEVAPPRPVYVLDRDGRPVLASVMEKRRERTRQRNTPAKRRSRAKLRAAAEAELASILGALDVAKPEPVRLSSEERTAERTALALWLKTDGPRQRQHRRDGKAYLAARIIALEMRAEMWTEPTPAAFAARWAERMREEIGRDRARNLLTALARLEAEGGPWHKTVTERA